MFRLKPPNSVSGNVQKVGARLPAGLRASLACAGWVLADLRRTRCSGALFSAPQPSENQDSVSCEGRAYES